MASWGTKYSDINIWEPLKPGNLLSVSGFVLCRTTFTPYSSHRKQDGQLVFKNVVGEVEIWLDNKLVGSKTSFEKADVEINFHLAKKPVL